MKLENWSVTVANVNPYTPPELQAHMLHGEVYGSLKFKDGERVTTTPIVGVNGDRIVTRSGSEYALGKPHPDYEAAFPNAKQRLLRK